MVSLVAQEVHRSNSHMVQLFSRSLLGELPVRVCACVHMCVCGAHINNS